jgi:hypothetical protein
MADYHTVYKDADPVETEWDILQRKHGNLPPKEPKKSAPAWEPEKEEAKGIDDIDSVDELEDLEDDSAFADDRFLEEYRQRRINELQQQQSTSWRCDGTLKHIQGQDFVKEVTEASDACWVVCHLFKDAVADCVILNQCLSELAGRYPGTKWVKIVSTECIPGFDDTFLPTLLLYNEKKCKHQVVQAVKAMGGQSVSPERVALHLRQYDDDICREEIGGSELRNERALVKQLVEERLALDSQDEDSEFSD